MSRCRPSLARLAVLALLSTPAWSGEIQSIDLSNFGPGPDVTGVTVRALYDRPVTELGAMTYGEIGWDIVKAVDPGIAVFNNVPPYNVRQIYADCIMAPRVYAITGDVDEACNDGFQTHKRYKMSANAVGPMELVFTVRNVDNVLQIVDQAGNPVAVDQDPTRNVYRMIGKLNNHTAGRLDGFKVELGFGLSGAAGGFTASTAGDGLSISLRDEAGGDLLADDELANFPGGLFYGPADARHTWGFFSSTRAGFTVDTTAFAAEQDSFQSTVLFGDYERLFGKWLPLKWVPPGWFEDHDGDPSTDAEVRAWFDGTRWLAYDIDPATGARTERVVPDTEIATWAATPATVWNDDGDPATTAAGTLYASWDNDAAVWTLADGSGTLTNDEMAVFFDAQGGGTTYERRAGYVSGPIEDLANLNLNYYIEVGDISSWPGYDAATGEAKFTLRITPLGTDAPDLPAWLPADLALTATGATVWRSEDATVTFTVTNNGEGDARDVVLTATIPAGLTVSGLGDPAACAVNGAELTCTLAELAAGASETFSVTLDSAAASGTFVVAATVASAVADPDAANDSATATAVFKKPSSSGCTIGSANAPFDPTLLLLGGLGLAGLSLRRLGRRSK